MASRSASAPATAPSRLSLPTAVFVCAAALLIALTLTPAHDTVSDAAAVQQLQDVHEGSASNVTDVEQSDQQEATVQPPFTVTGWLQSNIGDERKADVGVVLIVVGVGWIVVMGYFEWKAFYARIERAGT